MSASMGGGAPTGGPLIGGILSAGAGAQGSPPPQTGSIGLQTNAPIIPPIPTPRVIGAEPSQVASAAPGQVVSPTAVKTEIDPESGNVVRSGQFGIDQDNAQKYPPGMPTGLSPEPDRTLPKGQPTAIASTDMSAPIVTQGQNIGAAGPQPMHPEENLRPGQFGLTPFTYGRFQPGMPKTLGIEKDRTWPADWGANRGTASVEAPLQEGRSAATGPQVASLETDFETLRGMSPAQRAGGFWQNMQSVPTPPARPETPLPTPRPGTPLPPERPGEPPQFGRAGAPLPPERPSAPLPPERPTEQGTPSMEVPGFSQQASNIRSTFRSRGIDPDVALRVASNEGLHNYVGDHGSSFGPFQLHYGGMAPGKNAASGLGDVFTKLYGVHASDPKTLPQQIEFVADWVLQHGWSAFHGAARAGIHAFHGITGY